MKRLMLWVHENAAALILLFLCAALWQSARDAGALRASESEVDSMLRGIEDASARLLKPSDTLLLTTRNARLLKQLQGMGASLHEIGGRPPADTDQVLIRLLEAHCRNTAAQPDGSVYWILTTGSDTSADELAAAARELNFMYRFQAVLPNQGDAAHAVDNFLRLVPRERTIQDYCEIKRLVPDGHVIVLLSPEQFAPWIGSVTTGALTWLASAPQRTLRESDLAALNIPPLTDLDAYWLQVSYSPSWSFPHQDTAAFERVQRDASARGYPVLLASDASLGQTAASYLHECASGQPQLHSERFHQLCLK